MATPDCLGVEGPKRTNGWEVVASIPGKSLATGEVRLTPSVFRALWSWWVNVVLFSALAVLGPVFIPLLHSGRFDWNATFGTGELLAVALAVSAASVTRWVGHGGGGGTVQNIGVVVMAGVLLAITGIWLDEYVLGIHKEKTLIFPEAHVVEASLILIIVALVWGVVNEAWYALGLTDSPVAESE